MWLFLETRDEHKKTAPSSGAFFLCLRGGFSEFRKPKHRVVSQLFLLFSLKN
tara:strand:- start:2294 stop:2449 length:156 start_codon:yes stop_codon:yes gene_type:complete